jgi:hypothetical protein
MISELIHFDESSITSAFPLVEEKRAEDVKRETRTITRNEKFDKENLLLLLNFLKGKQDKESSKNYGPLLHYYMSSDWANGSVQVQYKFSKNSSGLGAELGRLYATTESLYRAETKSVALQTFPSWIRAALAAKYYYDVDMENAHPMILVSLCQQLANLGEAYQKKLDCTNVKFYCEHRELVLNLVAKYLSLPCMEVDPDGVNKDSEARKKSKKFMNALLFGSTIENYTARKGLSINVDHQNLAIEKNETVFSITKFRDEIARIRKMLYELKDIVIEGLSHKKDRASVQGNKIEAERAERLMKIFDTAWRSANQNDILDEEEKKGEKVYKDKTSSFLSLILQDLEREMLGIIEIQLQKFGYSVDTFIHDGCLVGQSISEQSSQGEYSKEFAVLKNLLIPRQRDQLIPVTEIDLTSLTWSLKKCEATIFDALKVAIVLKIKKLDTSEFAQKIPQDLPNSAFHRLKNSNPLMPPEKTYAELVYHYQRHHGLCYLKYRDAYWFDGVEYKKSVEPALPEKTCLYAEKSDFNQTQANHQQQQNQQQLQQNDEDLLNVNKLKSRNFWALYTKMNFSQQYNNIEFMPFQNSLFTESDPMSALKDTQGTMTESSIKKSASSENYQYLLENRNFPILRTETPCKNRILPFSDESILGMLTKTKSIPDNIRKGQLYQDTFLRSSTIKKNPSKFDNTADHQEKESGFSPLTQVILNNFFILLGRKQNYFEYFIKYIAKIAQNPGSKPDGCGLILFSDAQGNGKSRAAKIVASLFAPFSLTTQSLSRAFERFSSLMENRLVLHIEDSPTEENLRYTEELKARLTATEYEVEKKFLQPYRTKGLCRVILSTNTRDVLKLSKKDRRWAAFHCSDELTCDVDYFNKLNEFWDVPRVRQAVLLDLLSMDVSDFSCQRDIPKTAYLQYLKQDISENGGKRKDLITFEKEEEAEKKKGETILSEKSKLKEIEYEEIEIDIEDSASVQYAQGSLSKNRINKGFEFFEVDAQKKIKHNNSGDLLSMVSRPASVASSKLSRVSESPSNQKLMETMEEYFRAKARECEKDQEISATNFFQDFENWLGIRISEKDQLSDTPTKNKFGRMITLFKTEKRGITKRKKEEGIFYILDRKFWIRELFMS